jgi:hypothetical protein
MLLAVPEKRDGSSTLLQKPRKHYMMFWQNDRLLRIPLAKRPPGGTKKGVQAKALAVKGILSKQGIPEHRSVFVLHQ